MIVETDFGPMTIPAEVAKLMPSKRAPEWHKQEWEALIRMLASLRYKVGVNG